MRRVPYLSFRLDPEDGDEGTTSGSKEVGGLTPANEPWSLESELFRPWSPSNWRTMTSSSSPGNRMATSVLATGGEERRDTEARQAMPSQRATAVWTVVFLWWKPKKHGRRAVKSSQAVPVPVNSGKGDQKAPTVQYVLSSVKEWFMGVQGVHRMKTYRVSPSWYPMVSFNPWSNKSSQSPGLGRCQCHSHVSELLFLIQTRLVLLNAGAPLPIPPKAHCLGDDRPNQGG